MTRNLYYEDEVVEERFDAQMLRRLIAYASSYKKKYIKVQILMIVVSLLTLLPAALNKVIIDSLLPHDGVLPQNIREAAVCLLAIWLALSIGGVITNYVCSNLSNELGNCVICDLRKDLFRHLMKLGFDYYDGRPTGKILVRVTNYTDEIADFFINDLTRLLFHFFQMVFVLICICVIEYRLALAVIVVSTPLALAIYVLSRELHKRVEIDRSKYSNRTAFVSEDIGGLEVIRAFNREALNADIHEELNRKHFDAMMRTTRIRELFFPMSHGMVRIICTIVVYGLALFVVYNIHGTMSLGTVVTVSTFMGTFALCIRIICERLQQIANTTSNMERIFDVLDEEPTVKELASALPLEEIVPQVKGNIRFSHVSFSYQMGSEVLSDINLDIRAGQTIALVGPTGAGKTTLISLLARFYDVTAGSIAIDGVDIRDVTLDSLHRQIRVMMQDTYLFTDTIMENIRFARPEATDEECMEAARRIHADEFIQKLKDGYETKVTDADTSLSGGQRQLISFARLLLADPKIIIMDEATSNIDTETERRIRESMRLVLRGRTSFLIAHRLSTIREADRILYIDRQRVLEDGSHEELMEKKGCYYRLVTI